MLELFVVILIALKIAFVYGAMQPDNILFSLRRLLEKGLSYLPEKINLYLRKPLFDCMFCMSSFWGLVFFFVPLPLWLDVILSIAGLNYLLSTIIHYYHDQAQKDLPAHKVIEAKQEKAVGIEKPKNERDKRYCEYPNCDCKNVCKALPQAAGIDNPKAAVKKAYQTHLQKQIEQDTKPKKPVKKPK